MTQTKTFWLYDGRAKGGDTDDAIVLDTAPTEEEAREQGSTLWKDHDAIWYEYDLGPITIDDAGNEHTEVTNERARPDLPPMGGV